MTWAAAWRKPVDSNDSAGALVDKEALEVLVIDSAADFNRQTHDGELTLSLGLIYGAQRDQPVEL